MMKRMLPFLVILLLLPSVISAATYYVCDSGADCNVGAGSGWSTGSETNNGLSKSSPFKRIQQAADVVSAGDIVIVGDGTYTDSNTFDSVVYINRKTGTADNWITFRSENLHGAVLDGQNGTLDTGFYLYYNPSGGSQDAYVRIEGFEIKDFRRGGIHLRSPHDVYIYKNKIHGNGRNFVGDCPDPPNSGGIMPGAITSKEDTYNITVDSNLLYDIGRKHHEYCCVSDCKYDHIIYASGAGCIIKNNIL